MNFTDLTIVQAHEGLKKKDFSASELCLKYLEKIQKEDGKISAFLTVTRDLAISQAQGVDEKIAKGGNIEILEGIPCAIKDIILVEGVACTAASKILENYIAPYDATVTKRLKERGAVILGKTNLDEFAMGSSSENSAYKITKNPHDLTRVPGGSSSGSAAAVTADFCTFALGSDTGGSIRQPASFCGVVGLKPTYGAVSRYGLMAMASSLDQIGPFSKSVDDCRIVFEAIAGKDNLDATSVEAEHKAEKADSKSLKIGLPKEYFIEGMDPEVEKIIKRAVAEMEEAGAKVEEISLPHTEYGLAVYYIIMPAEISANLARYDGIKYGYSAAKRSKSEIKNLLDVYLQSREGGFGPEVRRRIMLGTYTLSAGYYDAYYLRAQKVRNLIKQDFSDAFEKVDAIFAPVSPTPAFKIGEKANDPLKMYLSDIFTVSANLAGLPAISVPCGKINNGLTGSPQGLPVGLQIIGRPFEENRIFNIAKILEQQHAC